MAPYVNEGFESVRRKRDADHFVSAESGKSNDSYNAILDTFRERIILLEILQHKRTPLDPALVPQSEVVTRDPTWQVFLNQISWLCDYDNGGDSTSSIAVENAPEGSKYWLAANFDKNKKGVEHLRKVLGMLSRLSTLPPEKHKPIFDRILKDSIDFSERKFSHYEKRLKTAIHFVDKSMIQEEDSLGIITPYIEVFKLLMMQSC